MTSHSAFREVIGFLDNLGLFDVVLPFILIFTIVFAMLDKTRIFGVDKIGDHEIPKKNLNAMVAFVVAFFTIASSRLVEIITEVSANMVVLLMASVLFLLLVGSFNKEEKEGYFLSGRIKGLFIGIMVVGLVFIFLNALQTSDGTTWLAQIFEWLSQITNETAVASVVLFIIVVGIMFLIVGTGNSAKKEDSH